MPSDGQLRGAYEQNRLWPTIHAAVEVYLRRSASGQDYERTWRLIHVWESTIITLASIAATRFKVAGYPTHYLFARSKTYGSQWNKVTSRLEHDSASCFSGSIDKWIELLRYVSDVDPSGDPVIDCIRHLLLKTGIDQGPLVHAWDRACKVTNGVEPTIVQVHDAFRTINQFRNRFAHVPFPHDPLKEIASAITACTETMLGLRLNDNDAPSALHGAVLVNRGERGLLQGGRYSPVDPAHFPAPTDGSDPFQTCFVHAYNPRTPCPIVWSTSGFVHVDGMLRPYTLTRVHGDDFADVEYTRYLAEANAVVVLDLDAFPKAWPKPSVAEYGPPEEVAAESPTEPGNGGESAEVTDAHDLPSTAFKQTRMDQAIDALRREDFDAAISFLTEVVTDRPAYHIGWLKLASAYREKAVRLLRSDGTHESISDYLAKSIDAAEKATEHTDRSYSAEAHYQLSKSIWRLWQMPSDPALRDPSLRERAREAAKNAVDLEPEERFASWLERISQDRNVAPATA